MTPLLRQRLVDELVGQTVLPAPGATVQLDHDRERPGALRPVEARQLRCVAVTHVLDVLDLELVAHGEPPLAAWKNATIRRFTSSGRSTCTKCPVPGTMTFSSPLRNRSSMRLERLEPAGPIAGAVQRERRHRASARLIRSCRRWSAGSRLAGMERVAIVAERRGHHAGLTERRLHPLDDRRGIELRRGVAPPLLEKSEVVGGHDLLGERHLEEVGVPDALVPLVAGGRGCPGRRRDARRRS